MNRPSPTVDGDGVFYGTTEFGFRWGAMNVERLFSREDGYTVLRVGGHGKHVDIYVSPQGRSVSVYPSGNVKIGGQE